MKFVRPRLAVLLLGFSIALFAQTDQKTQAEKAREAMIHQLWPNLTPNQNPAAVARGKQLFLANCAFCHGTEATGGNGGPDLVRSILVNHDEHGNLITPVIQNGRPEKGMPKFNFSDAQISDIVAFLHQRNRDARIRISYKVQNVMIGNAAAGKTYFDSHCNACHSVSGDLLGIGAKYQPDELQQLWLHPDANQPPQVSVVLPSGKSLSGKLKSLDEFNVSFYDSEGDYHDIPLTPGVKVQVEDALAAHRELLKHLSDTDMHNVTTYLGELK